MIEEIIAKIKKIDDSVMLNPNQITKMKVVLNTELKSSIDALYRIIKRGEIKTVNLGTRKSPKYFIKGSDLKEYLLKRYSTFDN